LRHQPQSALASCLHERVSPGRARSRKAAIVALARKLLVALLKYVSAGVVIEGAVVKASQGKETGDADRNDPIRRGLINPRPIRADEPIDCMATKSRRQEGFRFAEPESWRSRPKTTTGC